MPSVANSESTRVGQHDRHRQANRDLEHVRHRVVHEHAVEGIGDLFPAHDEHECRGADQRQLAQRISPDPMGIGQKQVHNQNDADHRQQDDLGSRQQKIGNLVFHGISDW
jgi:hypothetical protein